MGDHAPHLAAGHSHGPQRPELPGPLDDREYERVDDPEEAHQHGEAEQDVQHLQHLVDPRVLALHELGLGLELHVGIREQRVLQRRGVAIRGDERHRVPRAWKEGLVFAIRDRNRPEQRVNPGRLVDSANDETRNAAVGRLHDEVVADLQMVLLCEAREDDRAVVSEGRERGVRAVDPREVEEARDRRGVETGNGDRALADLDLAGAHVRDRLHARRARERGRRGR